MATSNPSQLIPVVPHLPVFQANSPGSDIYQRTGTLSIWSWHNIMTLIHWSHSTYSVANILYSILRQVGLLCKKPAYPPVLGNNTAMCLITTTVDHQAQLSCIMRADLSISSRSKLMGLSNYVVTISWSWTASASWVHSNFNPACLTTPSDGLWSSAVVWEEIPPPRYLYGILIVFQICCTLHLSLPLTVLRFLRQVLISTTVNVGFSTVDTPQRPRANEDPLTLLLRPIGRHQLSPPSEAGTNSMKHRTMS